MSVIFPEIIRILKLLYLIAATILSRCRPSLTVSRRNWLNSNLKKIFQEVVWQWNDELKTIASPKWVKYLSKVLQCLLSKTPNFFRIIFGKWSDYLINQIIIFLVKFKTNFLNHNLHILCLYFAMYQNVVNVMKTFRKVSFRNASYFLPIMSYDAIFNLSIVYFFSNIVNEQGVVCHLVFQLLNRCKPEICKS